MNKDYYDDAISFDNLYKGLKKACRNVRWKDSVIGYEFNGLSRTHELRQRLLDGTYQISPYEVFTIYEPKERTIVAARLVDRQFQRALCDNGLYQDIVEHFIRDNVACQKCKGTDDALHRMKVHMRRYYNKYGADGWVLKCDLHHFFPETRHDIAKNAVRKYASDPRAADAVCDIIDSFEGDTGIGLGSEVSQLVELLVLNDMDHFIKEKLHIKYYIRYMDDFVLIHNDKEYLNYCLKQITEHLTGLHLTLNKKTSLQPLNRGVKFLQWKFILTDTGKVLMLINPKKCTKERRKLKKLYEKEQAGLVPEGATYASYQAWMSNAQRGNADRARQKMMEFYYNLIRKGDNNGNR